MSDQIEWKFKFNIYRSSNCLIRILTPKYFTEFSGHDTPFEENDLTVFCRLDPIFRVRQKNLSHLEHRKTNQKCLKSKHLLQKLKDTWLPFSVITPIKSHLLDGALGTRCIVVDDFWNFLLLDGSFLAVFLPLLVE